MKGWDRATREHRAAVAAFLQGVERTDTGAWHRPVGPGKWTPAQIAEHLVLAYEALLRELDGGAPMRMRVGPAMERMLRWFLLPHVLFHRSLPLRALSPARPARRAPGWTSGRRRTGSPRWPPSSRSRSSGHASPILPTRISAASVP